MQRMGSNYHDPEKYWATDASRQDLVADNLAGCHFMKHRSKRSWPELPDEDPEPEPVPSFNERVADLYVTLYPILRSTADEYNVQGLDMREAN